MFKGIFGEPKGYKKMRDTNPPNMKVVSDTIKMHTEGEGDMIDMTSQLSDIVKESKIKKWNSYYFCFGVYSRSNNH